MNALLALALALLCSPPQDGGKSPPPGAETLEVESSSGGSTSRYTILLGGNAITQKQFALLVERPSDADRMDNIFREDRIKAWTFGGLSITFAGITLTSSLWVPNFSKFKAEAFYIGGIGLTLASGLFCYLSAKHIFNNEDSMFPSDPFYTYGEASRLAEDYNRKLEGSGKGSRNNKFAF